MCYVAIEQVNVVHRGADHLNRRRHRRALRRISSVPLDQPIFHGLSSAIDSPVPYSSRFSYCFVMKLNSSIFALIFSALLQFRHVASLKTPSLISSQPTKKQVSLKNLPTYRSKAISESLENNFDDPSPAGQLFSCSEEICYDEVGCFEPWPFSVVYGLYKYSVCPEDPRTIATTYVVFSSKVPHKDPVPLDSITAEDKIVLFIHGYANNFNDTRFMLLKDNLLEVVDIVIMVDYARGSDPGIGSRTGLVNFYQAAANSQVVGRQITNFVSDLKRFKHIDPGELHLVGYSLGSHVIHFAAEFASKEYGFSYGRATGLDPPGVLLFDPSKRIQKSDAKFVDIIHTTQFKSKLWDIFRAHRGKVGLPIDAGHVDFYPNGGGEEGEEQPGCDGKDWCSHNFALLLLRASIKNCEFNAYKCKSWKDFETGECSTHSNTRLGYWSYKYTGRGRYYLATSNSPLTTC